MSKKYIVTTRGFRMLPSYFEAIDPMPSKIRLQLYDSLMRFGFCLVEPSPDMDPVTLAIFAALRPTLERSVHHFQAQYENGCRGGRPEGVRPQSSEQSESGDNTEKAQGYTPVR